jgi:hypothetical protein
LKKNLIDLLGQTAMAAAGVIQDRSGAVLPDGPGQPVCDVVKGFRPG